MSKLNMSKKYNQIKKGPPSNSKTILIHKIINPLFSKAKKDKQAWMKVSLMSKF